LCAGAALVPARFFKNKKVKQLLTLAAFLFSFVFTGNGTELPEGFRWMRDLIGGTWEGKFPDGKTVHSQTYTSQFGRFLRGSASLSGDHGGQMTSFSGDSVFACDSGSPNVVYYVWGSDGNHGREEAYFDGERIVFPVHSKKEPGKVRFRSVWTRLDADSFRVDREVPIEAGWKVTLSVTYHRARRAESCGQPNQPIRLESHPTLAKVSTGG
jgi:hypothetical protein